ncbi:hypothetical protein Tco_1059867, partial [Tanacetum coccineum]
RRRCTQVAKIRPDALGIDKEDNLVLEAKFVLSSSYYKSARRKAQKQEESRFEGRTKDRNKDEN